MGVNASAKHSRLAKNRINSKFLDCKSSGILLFLINKCILTNYMVTEILLIMYSVKTGIDLTLAYSKPLYFYVTAHIK